LFVLNIQSLDPEARGWTKWEKLENHIKELWVGYRDDRHTLPKDEAFVPRILLCISYCKRTDLTLLNSLDLKYYCQDVVYSDYHYKTETQRI